MRLFFYKGSPEAVGNLPNPGVCTIIQLRFALSVLSDPSLLYVSAARFRSPSFSGATTPSHGHHAICAILYYTILYYTILYYTILYSTLLYYTLLYSTLLYSTILYYTILYYTILYSTLLYSTLLYSTLLYSTILYYTIL